MTTHRLALSLVAGTLIFGAAPALASELGTEGIGFYMAVSGQVGVTHPHNGQTLPVKLHDQVLFKDVIQTKEESRTKAFFQDDSMLTVGESSRVEINEYIYNPEQNVRKAVVKLLQGQVRALVSKVFKANGSRFEIHTPSAVAAARGTYFTVWVENGRSGIINIGETGRVDFTSGGVTVAVDPGYFSVALEGKAPSVPAPHPLNNQMDNLQAGSSLKHTQRPASSALLTHDAGRTVTTQREKAELILASVPGGLARALMAVELTTLREGPLVELPAQALQALNVDGHLVKAMTTLASLSNESLNGDAGGTTAGQGTGQVSASVTVGGSTGATAAVTAAPVASATVTVAPVTAVVAPVVAPVVAVVAPVIAPVVAVVPVVPVVPIIPAVLAIPPAVINGALNLLGH
ncbi:MAG: FecR family protein [Nitrospirota bacterium]|nr:FecR family protein [Nitrospirota bacterium]MDP2382322.1 FecR family protein [Nitrospirota bacterium]MDP3598711.1 FecR family protein [Nitrospirota bacterium]